MKNVLAFQLFSVWLNKDTYIHIYFDVIDWCQLTDFTWFSDYLKHELHEINPIMLLVANFANINDAKKLKNDWKLGIWVYSSEITQQGLSNEYQHDRF